MRFNRNTHFISHEKINESRLYTPLSLLAPAVFPYLRFQHSEPVESRMYLKKKNPAMKSWFNPPAGKFFLTVYVFPSVNKYLNMSLKNPTWIKSLIFIVLTGQILSLQKFFHDEFY